MGEVVPFERRKRARGSAFKPMQMVYKATITIPIQALSPQAMERARISLDECLEECLDGQPDYHMSSELEDIEGEA